MHGGGAGGHGGSAGVASPLSPAETAFQQQQELELLRRRCGELSAERDALRAQLQALLSQDPESPGEQRPAGLPSWQLQRKPPPAYEVSPSVMLVSGGRQSTLPLLDLLLRQRCAAAAEADTPTCSGPGGQPPPWASPAPAGSAPAPEPSGGGSPPAATNGGGRQPGTPPHGSPPQRPAPAGAGGGRWRPQPLSHGALGEPGHDSLVSAQTLRSFQLEYAAEPEEGSACARGVLEYLCGPTGFAANGFEHPPQSAESFGRQLVSLCQEVEQLLRREPLHLSVASPCFVFGDIHGNFRDVHFFVEQLLPFRSFHYCTSQFLFLGDYVDRGPSSVECVALLFALKALAPGRVWLMRGNHEDRMINGDMSLYKQGSFRAQCHSLLGSILGEHVWSAANAAFQWLPLTANIDGVIFCTHGGIPRHCSAPGEPDRRMEVLTSTASFPRFQTLFEWNPQEPQHVTFCRQVASDCCWSDPSEGEGGLNADGFGPNPRGRGIIQFGSKAVDDFLERFGFQYIFRAHQEKADGIKVSKNRRVITIFSSSDYIGHDNGAGVVFVADGRIRMVIKEPGRSEARSPQHAAAPPLEEEGG
eukprot:TRINITY_DN3474_c0_g1_i1.p1 TRINITY_DN3474_c0_g1~~TRINITY_DN3474_c0_g1_i1.p1  ORF type:complete len:610 (+),score=205.88 TRINITY_DN3474_c0_g1_i1:71-1831(+)